MRIAIYCEPLLVKTSGNPGRGMLAKLIALRHADQFILIFRNGSEHDPIRKELLDSLTEYPNWELYVEKVSRRVMNLKGLFRIWSYSRISVYADVYINTDCTSLGKHAHPLIITVADLSVFKGKASASYSNSLAVGLRKFMLSEGIRRADSVVSISQGTKDAIAVQFPAASLKVEVVYNGIAENWFAYRKNGQADEPPYWIWFGMISNRKNMARLLRAYQLLHKQHPSLNLPVLKIIYSNATVPQDIIAETEKLAVKSKIHFEKHKPLEQLIHMVAGSEGLLLPSVVEGFGLPVIEAYSCGVPVLTSDIPALREIAGGHAILCDPEQETSISTGLFRLYQAENFSTEAVEARKAWASHFSYQHAAMGYSTLINKHSGGKS
jgi:glycosyltransferase involved in cell wall biosynthesis